MSDAVRKRTPEEKRKLRNERQRRWRARQHPHRQEKMSLVPTDYEIVGMLGFGMASCNRQE